MDKLKFFCHQKVDMFKLLKYENRLEKKYERILKNYYTENGEISDYESYVKDIEKLYAKERVKNSIKKHLAHASVIIGTAAIAVYNILTDPYKSVHSNSMHTLMGEIFTLSGIIAYEFYTGDTPVYDYLFSVKDKRTSTEISSGHDKKILSGIAINTISSTGFEWGQEKGILPSASGFEYADIGVNLIGAVPILAVAYAFSERDLKNKKLLEKYLSVY